jgi:hypothetical protein
MSGPIPKETLALHVFVLTTCGWLHLANRKWESEKNADFSDVRAKAASARLQIGTQWLTIG